MESVIGTVWHHQRRRQVVTSRRDPATTPEPAEQNATAAGGERDQRRPNEEANPRTPHSTSNALGGALQHMRHVQWESPLNAPTVDNNLLVANLAREAAGEVLSSFGTGATVEMTQALATWLASHVRSRHGTRAPNHWCWSITTVCWLISRAMRHNGNEQGLNVRFLASYFGMNAAGMRQRPISTWEQGGASCEYAFELGTLPPGAQSLGENESIVSHTNPRVSRAADTLLDRLAQAIWSEPPQEDPEDQASGDEPPTDHDDMQVDTEEGTVATDTAMDSTPPEDPANTPADAGVAGEEHGGGNAHPAAPQCDAGEAQDRDNYHCTQGPTESGYAETQGSNEHSASGTFHTRSTVNSKEVEDPFASAGISPTIPFTHPDASPPNGDHGEGAPEAVPGPEHIGERNGQANFAGNPICAGDGSRTGQSCATNMARRTHAEQGGQPGHHNPASHDDHSGGFGNPAYDNPGNDALGYGDEHTEIDPSSPNADSNSSEPSREAEHPRESSTATINIDNQFGATDARNDVCTPVADSAIDAIHATYAAGASDAIDTSDAGRESDAIGAPDAVDATHATGATDAQIGDGTPKAVGATDANDATYAGGTHDAIGATDAASEPGAIAAPGATDATHAAGATDAQNSRCTSDGRTDQTTTSRTGHDGDPQYRNRDTSIPTARRLLMGDRAEPVARRMRTSGPTQGDEPPAVHTSRWGLGTCSADERWNICDRYVSENGTAGSSAGLLQSLVRGGCPSSIAELTLQTWFQAGLLIHDGERIRPGNIGSQGSLQALQPPGSHDSHPRGGTSVALLSLFDGTGLARIAMDEAIQDCGGIRLVRSAFVEHDRALAGHVEAVWNNEVSSSRTTVAHSPIATDIWD